MTSLAERLQLAIDRAKISMRDLAASMGISPSALYMILNGDTKTMKSTNLFSAAQKLGVQPRWLEAEIGPMTAINIPNMPPDQVRVLQLDANGDMGDGAQNDDFPDIVHAMDFDASYIRALIGFIPPPARLRLITGRNDSMMPIINPGEILIVDTGITYFDGDGIYLINSGNGQQIKGLQDRGTAIHVVSANAQLYPAFAMPHGTIIGGKVYLRNRIDRLS